MKYDLEGAILSETSELLVIYLKGSILGGPGVGKRIYFRKLKVSHLSKCPQNGIFGFFRAF